MKGYIAFCFRLNAAGSGRAALSVVGTAKELGGIHELRSELPKLICYE